MIKCNHQKERSSCFFMDDYIEYLIVNEEPDSDNGSGNNKNNNDYDGTVGCLTPIIIIVVILWLIGKFFG